MGSVRKYPAMKEFRRRKARFKGNLTAHPWRTKEEGEGEGGRKRKEKGEQTREPVPGSNLN